MWTGQSVVGSQFGAVEADKMYQLYSDDFYDTCFTKKLRGACALWFDGHSDDPPRGNMEAYVDNGGTLRLVLTSKGYDFFAHKYPEIPTNPLIRNMFERISVTKEQVNTGRFIFIRFLPDPIKPKIELDLLGVFTNTEVERDVFQRTINGARANGFEMEDNLSLDVLLENKKPIRMQLAE